MNPPIIPLWSSAVALMIFFVQIELNGEEKSERMFFRHTRDAFEAQANFFGQQILTV